MENMAHTIDLILLDSKPELLLLMTPSHLRNVVLPIQRVIGRDGLPRVVLVVFLSGLSGNSIFLGRHIRRRRGLVGYSFIVENGTALAIKEVRAKGAEGAEGGKTVFAGVFDGVVNGKVDWLKASGICRALAEDRLEGLRGGWSRIGGTGCGEGGFGHVGGGFGVVGWVCFRGGAGAVGGGMERKRKAGSRGWRGIELWLGMLGGREN